jgi:hypothetical protein
VSEALQPPPSPHTAVPARPRRRKKLALHTLERLMVAALLRAEMEQQAGGGGGGGGGGDSAERKLHGLFSGNVISGLQRMHTLSKVSRRFTAKDVYREVAVSLGRQ